MVKKQSRVAVVSIALIGQHSGLNILAGQKVAVIVFQNDDGVRKVPIMFSFSPNFHCTRCSWRITSGGKVTSSFTSG